MYSPLVNSCDVIDVNGNVKADISNFKNAYQRSQYLRILDFECTGELIYKKKSHSDKMTIVNLDGSRSSEDVARNKHYYTEGYYVIQRCSYKIDTIPTIVRKFSGKVSKEQSVGIAVTPKVVKSKSEGHVNIKINSRYVRLPSEGICVIKGDIPIIAPYVRYNALCEFQPSEMKASKCDVDRTRTTKKLEPVDICTFNIVQILGVEIRNPFRNLDLLYILKEEIKMEHLYDTLVDECLMNINKMCANSIAKISTSSSKDRNITISKVKKLQDIARDPQMHHVWDSRFLDPSGSNVTIYKSEIIKTKWHRLSKFSLLFSVFPNLTYFFLNNFDDAMMQELLDSLSDRRRNWEFIMHPMKLVEMFPAIFKKIITYEDGSEYDPESAARQPSSEKKRDSLEEPGEIYSELKKMGSYMINKRSTHLLRVNKKRLNVPIPYRQSVDFYEKEVVKSMESSGSTLVTLSNRTLVSQMRSENYKNIFGNGCSEGLGSLLDMLVNSKLLVKLDRSLISESVKDIFRNMQRKSSADEEDPDCRRNNFTANMYTDIFVESINLERFPKDSFSLKDCWLNALGIMKNLLRLSHNFNSKVIAQLVGSMQDFKKSNASNVLLEISQSRVNYFDYIPIGRLSDNVKSKLQIRLDSNFQYRFPKRDSPGGYCLLTTEQTAVVIASLMYPTVSLIGTPGTGKTLVIEALFELHLEKCGIYNGIVAIMTHGGCMANELLKKGLKGAKTIHSALNDAHRINKTTEVELICSNRFKYENVELLIIDEFSNVDDELASLIYDVKFFPNLKTVIHVFDPLQTGPIGMGSLATDYMQTLPKVDVVNDSLISDLISKAVILENAGKVTRAKAFEFVKYATRIKSMDTVAKMILINNVVIYFSKLHGSLVSQNKIRENVLKMCPPGVCLCLNRQMRFKKGSLISENDQKLLVGCKSFFSFDRDSFSALPCKSMFTPELMRIAKNEANDVIIDLVMNKTLNSLCKYPIGQYIYDKMEVHHTSFDEKEMEVETDNTSNAMKKSFQMLALTNSVCQDLNTACDYIYNFISNTKKISDISESTTMPSVCRGSKLLVRDSKPSFEICCNVISDIRNLEGMLIYYRNHMEVPNCMVTKKSDLIDAGISHIPGTSDFNKLDKLNPNYYLLINCKERLMNTMAKNLERCHLKLVRELNSLSSIKTSPVYNGTVFNFEGLVDLQIGPLKQSQLVNYMKSKQNELVELMEKSLALCKGKGSQHQKRSIRKSIIYQHQKLYSTKYICDVILMLEKSRWKCPYGTNLTLSEVKEDVMCDRFIKYRDVNRSYADVKCGWQRFLIGSDGIFLALGKEYLPAQLLQPGWAITVNFSQGKEYDEVAFVIPTYDCAENDKSNHEMTNRKLMTSKFANFDRSHCHVAISRSKDKFVLFGDKDDLQELATRNNECLTTRNSVVKSMMSLVIDHQMKGMNFREKVG